MLKIPFATRDQYAANFRSDTILIRESDIMSPQRMHGYLFDLLSLIFGACPDEFSEYNNEHEHDQYYAQLVTDTMILYSLGFRLTIPLFTLAACEQNQSLPSILPRLLYLKNLSDFSCPNREEYLILMELQAKRFAAAVPVLPWPSEIQLAAGDNTYPSKLQRVFFIEWTLYNLVRVPAADASLCHYNTVARQRKAERKAEKRQQKEGEQQEEDNKDEDEDEDEKKKKTVPKKKATKKNAISKRELVSLVAGANRVAHKSK
jgi:hypothetical protein